MRQTTVVAIVALLVVFSLPALAGSWTETLQTKIASTFNGEVVLKATGLMADIKDYVINPASTGRIGVTVSTGGYTKNEQQPVMPGAKMRVDKVMVEGSAFLILLQTVDPVEVTSRGKTKSATLKAALRFQIQQLPFKDFETELKPLIGAIIVPVTSETAQAR